MNNKRDIFIKAPFNKAYRFLSEAKNLPKWTTFFQELVEGKDYICVMKTPIGMCQTHCEVSNDKAASKIKIISKFEHKTETATLFLKKIPNYCHVVFYLNTPPKLDSAVRAKMLKNLEKELLVLKASLEASND